MARVMSRISRTVGRLALGAGAVAAAAALMAPTAAASPESEASDAINQAWQAAGGSGSPVGGRDGEVYQVGGGYGQKFSEGKIFFSPSTGAHLIYGAILDKYESLGGPADSDLGFPNIDEVRGLVGPSSRVSTFGASDKPAIFWTPDTGAWAVRGAINAAWDKLGGSAGALGVPVEDERHDGDVVSQRFTGGQLSWNSRTNTFTSDPAGLADSLSGVEAPLDPTTMINLAWRASGGLGGPLGARQGEQESFGDNVAAQGYASGKIFYSPQTGAHALTGAILSKYESLGGPTGDLGLPVAAEAEGGVPNSRVSSFSAPDEPVIFWTPDTGAVVVRGPINAAWAKLGAATGRLGAPTAEQNAGGDSVTQSFTGGELSWNRVTKEFSSKPADLAAELSGLQVPDTLEQTPAAPAPGESTKGGPSWWWLAIVAPALLLLGLLAVLARRKARPAGGPAERDLFTHDSDERWPPTPATAPSEPRHGDPERDSGYRAARRADGPAVEPAVEGPEPEPGVDDEDVVDTAPTRVIGAAEIAEPATPAPDLGGLFGGAGRHSAGTPSGSTPGWRLELDEMIDQSRRRRGADEAWSEGLAAAAPGLPVAPEEQLEATGGLRPVQPELEGGDAAAQPWRPAIHLPLSDPFQAPEGYRVKGNTHSGLYYTPESVLYDSTLPEVWFASEELAQANGFVKAPD